MERMTIDDIEPWLLSGEAVVRLKGRDFDQPVADYLAWLSGLAASLSLGMVSREIHDPPGVVAQVYLGDAIPSLADPLIAVSKKNTPWLFCIYPKCRIRTEVPGSMCEVHR